MYCPKCSQQQASDQARFCSRCGFRMDGVAQLLAADGTFEQGEAQSRWSKMSLRKAGLRLWALLMVFTIGISPLVMAIGNSDDGKVMLSVVAGIFFAGLFWALYFRIFERDAQSSDKSTQPRAAIIPRKAALSPLSDVVISGVSPQRVNTADMLQPPSITETTTNLLEG